MKKNFLVVAVSAAALMIGAQSAVAFGGMAPMVEATATAVPVVSFPWQGQAGGQSGNPGCKFVSGDVRPSFDARPSGDIRPSFDVRPTGDARPSFDVRSGDVRKPGCGFGRGHGGGKGHHLGSGDVRGSHDVRMSGDVRGSWDVRGSHDVRESGDVRHGGHIRPMPPVFSGDVRPSGDVRGPGFGSGNGHGRGGQGRGPLGRGGHAGPDGDNAGNGFVLPAPAVTASTSPSVSGAAVTQQGQQSVQAPQFQHGRQNGGRLQGGRGGNH